MRDYKQTYSKMADGELLNVARQVDALLPEARSALAIELASRKLDAAEVTCSEPLQASAARTFSISSKVKSRILFAIWAVDSVAWAYVIFEVMFTHVSLPAIPGFLGAIWGGTGGLLLLPAWRAAKQWPRRSNALPVPESKGQ